MDADVQLGGMREQHGGTGRVCACESEGSLAGGAAAGAAASPRGLLACRREALASVRAAGGCAWVLLLSPEADFLGPVSHSVPPSLTQPATSIHPFELKAAAAQTWP